MTNILPTEIFEFFGTLFLKELKIFLKRDFEEENLSVKSDKFEQTKFFYRQRLNTELI